MVSMNSVAKWKIWTIQSRTSVANPATTTGEQSTRVRLISLSIAYNGVRIQPLALWNKAVTTLGAFDCDLQFESGVWLLTDFFLN